MKHYGRSVVFAWLVACISCTSSQPDRRVLIEDEFARPPQNEVGREQAMRPGIEQQLASGAPPGLEVRLTDQTTDGRVMKLRGKLRNPLPEPIKGVRMVMRLYSAAPGSNELEVLQKEMTSTLASGGTTMIRWDVESMYFGQSGRSGFTLEAYPKRVGDKDIPPPPGWKE